MAVNPSICECGRTDPTGHGVCDVCLGHILHLANVYEEMDNMQDDETPFIPTTPVILNHQPTPQQQQPIPILNCDPLADELYQYTQGEPGAEVEPLDNPWGTEKVEIPYKFLSNAGQDSDIAPLPIVDYDALYAADGKRAEAETQAIRNRVRKN